jgi:hypothetical protein
LTGGRFAGGETRIDGVGRGVAGLFAVGGGTDVVGAGVAAGVETPVGAATGSVLAAGEFVCVDTGSAGTIAPFNHTAAKLSLSIVNCIRSRSSAFSGSAGKVISFSLIFNCTVLAFHRR